VHPQFGGGRQAERPRVRGRGGVEIAQPAAGPEYLQRLASQVGPARFLGDSCSFSRQVLGPGPGARPAVTQRHLGMDDGSFHVGRLVGWLTALNLRQLDPGVLPPCRHHRGPGKDQAHGGGGGEVAAIGDSHHPGGDRGRIGGLSRVQQHLCQLAGDLGAKILAALGGKPCLAQEQLGR